MNLNTILTRAWQQLWHHRALWLFGAILALVGVTALYPFPWPDPDNDDEWTKIKVSDHTTVRVPGPDVIIDLTAPEGVRIITEDATSWREFRETVEALNLETSINLWPILIEFAMIVALSLVLAIFARYIAETAVIRMVDEAEATGRRLSLWDGLRRGFSFRAGRLFLLDLIVSLLGAMVFIVVFGLAVAPVLLAIGRPEAVLVTAGLSAFALLVLAGYLWMAGSAVLSLVLQPVRRACVLDERSLLASIRHGVLLTKHHLKDVGLVWLIWMGIRLLWLPVGALVLILLAPFLLLTTLAGTALGGVTAALVGVVAILFVEGATPWIMGALAGLPIFIVVTVSPMLFVSGLVEIYKSCLWTLAYRDLRAMERPLQAPAPQAPVLTARGVEA